MAATATRIPWWAWAWPVAGWAIIVVTAAAGGNGWLYALAGITLVATVFAAVYHAEVIAHRIGEPYGTLVLAIAVTVIEVALIVSVMLGGPADKAALARDTVFASVMIACNGVVGLCLLAGGVRHHTQGFHIEGASAALAVLAALTTLTLILPNVTSTPGPVFSNSQLIFAGIISLVLYGAYVFVQTVSHRGYFLPVKSARKTTPHAPPSDAIASLSAALLLVSLVAVVGLAKTLTPTLEFAVARLDVPKAVVGVVLALLVLMPEGLAALRAARANELQTSLNLALGSALASIGLTIPAVAAVSIVLHTPLQLGLGTKDEVLLALTVIVGIITLGTGRTTVLQGIVHLVIFAAFLFFAVAP